MLTIGEFSASTRLTVKALRMYHDEGLIVPERTDPTTGYRYYGEAAWQRAQSVKMLRDLGFSHHELKTILQECRDDADLGIFLKKRLEAVDDELMRMRAIRDRIAVHLQTEKEMNMKATSEIKDTVIPRIIVCTLRYKGLYGDMGKYFGPLFKKAGRYASGPAMAFYHDPEYREDDADIEPALPVKKEVTLDGIVCRIVPETRVLSVLHCGSYETLGDSYKKLYEAIASAGLRAFTPSSEIYLKGPGMIFKRDPKNFVTEIRIPVEAASGAR